VIIHVELSFAKFNRVTRRIFAFDPVLRDLCQNYCRVAFSMKCWNAKKRASPSLGSPLSI